jgi:ACS family D-galactonate transporter-like MFS transporter
MSKSTYIRYQVLSLLFINVVINYMDRTNIAIAATSISTAFHLSSVRLGLIFSAFGWTYVALQIPGGLLTDRIGPRILYALSLISWSFVTLFQGFAGSFAVLFGFRLATGALEAPAYPINNRVVTGWFPERERASAIAVYTSGQYIGLALLTPVMASVQHYLGWRWLFILTGVTGVAWGIIWYMVYRDPSKHKQVSAAELRYIREGGGIVPGGTGSRSLAADGQAPEVGDPALGDGAPSLTGPRFNWNDLREVFSHRKLWGIYIGQFAITSTLWFFLTWFPIYLEKYRGINFLKTGFLASIPFLAAFIGILISGFLSDFLVKKQISTDIARKLPVLTGLLLSISIVGANYVHSTWLIILFLAIAFFGNGMASITWVFVSLLAPKHLVGMTGGAFNFIGGLSSVSVPFVIGYLVRGGDFAPALLFISSLALLGICCYVFLVGRIERVETKKI